MISDDRGVKTVYTVRERAVGSDEDDKDRRISDLEARVEKLEAMVAELSRGSLQSDVFGFEKKV